MLNVERKDSASTKTDFRKLSNKLRLDSDGVWRSTKKTPVSYPVAGNYWCGQVEEKSYWFKHRNRVIAEVFHQFLPKGWVADIGGGNGFVAQALQQLGYEMVLIEPGEDGIKLAQERGIHPIIGSTLEDAEFKPNSIPAAGLFDTLEHISNDSELLKDLFENLEPGGRLYITVPAYKALRSIEDDFVGHIHRYSQKELIHKIQQSGFAVDYCSYFFMSLIFPIFVLRSIPYRLGLIRKFDENWFMQQLNPKSQFLDRIVNSLINWELKWIAGKRTIGFGASLIVAAHKI
jgi:SAM-dependent methyltransferase